MTQQLDLTTSQLAESLLTFKGKSFSLKGYEPFREIYDCAATTTTIKCSRQVGKSLSTGAILTAKSVGMPFCNSLYVAPLSNQTSRFSTLYADPFLDSPLVKKYYRDTNSKKNVFEKSLSNGSVIFLSYSQTEQDTNRIRGVSADFVYLDEIATMALESLPIIYETLSASEYACKRHYGTPLSELNTLEVLFKRGSGNEWATRCTHCGKWSIPWTIEDCLAMCRHPEGPCCVHCGKRIEVITGHWVSARPTIKDHVSFHLPRIVLEARTNPKKWAEIQQSIKDYAISKLSTEVFGLAAGIAGRILSEREAIACCNPDKRSFDETWPMDHRSIVNVVLGVDWSVTGGVASYTCASVLGYDYTGKCYVLYSEKMQGIDILDQVKRVEQLFMKYNCQILASDRGVGVLQGQLLQQSLGADKVVMVQYSTAKVPLRYDKAGNYLSADRTSIMDSAILKMKLGRDKFETPCWDVMAPFWSDALSLYEEETLSGRRLYRKDEGTPDDWAHSVVFAHAGWMVLTGQYVYVDSIHDM